MSETQSRVNYAEIASGLKGSGKSHLLARRAARFPRRLILDYADEFFDVYDDAFECLSWPQMLQALRAAAHEKTWVIVASLMLEDVIKLANVLSPAGRPRSGYSYNVGGLIVECGEVELIAPNRGFHPAIAELVHRGRHSRTSMAWGTRRPRDVNRLVTSQADVISCFRQQETADIEYLASIIGVSAASRISTLAEHHHVQYIPKVNRASVVNGDGEEIEVL